MTSDEPTLRRLQMVRNFLEEQATSSDTRINSFAQELVRDGKMLRSQLAFLVLNLGDQDGSDLDRAVVGAGSVELLHLASLVHDDVIDRAEVRRGRPTAHSVLGEGSAVLLGDLLLARGAQCAASLGGESAAAWAATFDALTQGQILESEVRRAPSSELHVEYISLKTAALMQGCCEIACHAWKFSEELVGAYGAFGRAFGIAFQMADDLLDVIGDASVMGKPTGSDVVNGILTIPMLHARDREPSKFRALVYGNDPVALARLTIATGGIDAALCELLRTLGRSGDGLDRVGLADEAERLSRWAMSTVRAVLVSQTSKQFLASVESAFHEGIVTV